jgi:hypothetical protein
MGFAALNPSYTVWYGVGWVERSETHHQARYASTSGA